MPRRLALALPGRSGLPGSASQAGGSVAPRAGSAGRGAYRPGETAGRAAKVATIASALALVACGGTAVPVVTLVAPPPSGRAPVTTALPRAAAAPSPFLGCWVEEAETRAGCSDTIDVQTSDGALLVTSADCNDGASYAVERAVEVSDALDLELRVPSNGTRIVYTLRPSGRRSLEGSMQVTIGHEVTSLKVSWRRCETRPTPDGASSDGPP